MMMMTNAKTSSSSSSSAAAASSSASETTTQGPARRGFPLVVSAPSGAGKTTLCHRLRAELGGVVFSVSHTTRARRGEERDGVDYYFVSQQEYDDLVAADAFVEWARVHGHGYGTGRRQLEAAMSRGEVSLLDIDVQGGIQVAARMPEAVLVFVMPPDRATLENRLRGRGSDSEATVAKRLLAARHEIEVAAQHYTYFIVNDRLDDAVSELRSIVVAERLRRADRQALVAPWLA